jgi:hypothetical protein
MVTDQFDVFAGFGRYRIIGDQQFFFQWRIFAMGNYFQRQKVDKFSPVKPLMINEPIIGVFLSIYLIFQGTGWTKILSTFFLKREAKRIETSMISLHIPCFWLSRCASIVI